MVALPGGASPRLASAGVLVRRDGQMLLARHAAGPFAKRWSMPLTGVSEGETAEDALARLLRQVLHVEPGPFAFLDTLYVQGADGERFAVNAFSCVDWRGDPALRGGPYDEAVWAPPLEAGTLDLLPEVRDWIAASAADPGRPRAPLDAASIVDAITAARGELIAAYDLVPARSRRDEHPGGWSALDVLAHAAEVEAYMLGEARRCLAEPGRTWRLFNDAQWSDLRRLRPPEDEATVRARLQAVRGATRIWLAEAGDPALHAYVNHETRGVVQVGARLAGMADHDRAHADQLRDMASASAAQ